MFVVNTVLAFGTAMVLVGWTSSEIIMYNEQKFMINVMENDESWAEQLNVFINVDVETVSAAALTVLKRLKAVTPKMLKELEERSWAEPVTKSEAERSIVLVKESAVKSKTKQDATELTAKTKENLSAKMVDTQKPKVVRVNALHVVADVVSLHKGESDALKFGLAAIASAVKCDVFQHVAVQVNIIGRTLNSQPVPTNATRLSAVWDTLVLFLDKLARLKESVDVESKLYRTWVTVVERLVAGTLKASDVEPFRELVDVERQSTCGHVVPVEQVPEKLGFNGNAEWDLKDGINAIFVKCQKVLDKIFEQLPISTMDRDLWDVYLNRTELMEKLAAIIAKKPAESSAKTEEKTKKSAVDKDKATTS